LVSTGDFKPPEDAISPAAATKEATALRRALGVAGNALFYGTVVTGAAFIGSTYVYSDEDIKKWRDLAEEHRDGGVAAEAKATVLEHVLTAREYFSEKMKGFTGAPPSLPFSLRCRAQFVRLKKRGVTTELHTDVTWCASSQRVRSSACMHVACMHAWHTSNGQSASSGWVRIGERAASRGGSFDCPFPG
jgi:hypothetical protein